MGYLYEFFRQLNEDDTSKYPNAVLRNTLGLWCAYDDGNGRYLCRSSSSVKKYPGLFFTLGWSWYVGSKGERAIYFLRKEDVEAFVKSYGLRGRPLAINWTIWDDLVRADDSTTPCYMSQSGASWFCKNNPTIEERITEPAKPNPFGSSVKSDTNEYSVVEIEEMFKQLLSDLQKKNPFLGAVEDVVRLSVNKNTVTLPPNFGEYFAQRLTDKLGKLPVPELEYFDASHLRKSIKDIAWHLTEGMHASIPLRNKDTISIKLSGLGIYRWNGLQFEIKKGVQHILNVISRDERWAMEALIGEFFISNGFPINLYDSNTHIQKWRSKQNDTFNLSFEINFFWRGDGLGNERLDSFELTPKVSFNLKNAHFKDSSLFLDDLQSMSDDMNEAVYNTIKSFIGMAEKFFEYLEGLDPEAKTITFNLKKF